MAIVRASDNIIGVDEFIDGLSMARKALIRVVVADPRQTAVCTAWFLTPSLVITPGFAVRPQASRGPETDFLLQRLTASGVDWEERVTTPELLGVGVIARAPTEPAIGLFHVNSVPQGLDGGLRLCFDSPKTTDLIAILHYPEGRPKASVSFGRVVGVEDALVSYDANTRPGSSGAPVFSNDWKVIAIHLLADIDRMINQGLSRGALLDVLRGSQWWQEIAEFHRIADDAAAKKQLEEPAAAPAAPSIEAFLVRAALSPSFDRASLTADQQSQLRDRVIDPMSERWTLRPAERRAIITSVGSLPALKALSARSTPPHDAAERVIDDILGGPPYDIAGADEESLSWWIQASRWFADIAPKLPAPAAIARELERRRIRSRLGQVAGPWFHGRHREMQELQDWFDSNRGPLVITGVGGIGKSALVARFVSHMPSDALLLWLDFDRADLAPDDAVSVLSALAEQSAVQLEGFETPPIMKEDWEKCAQNLGERINASASREHAPILVLDSFEAAQYAERYQELWPVLEHISKAVPELRVIVTGRAPVPGLRLGDRPAVQIHLKGLSADDARDWLREKGVTDPALLAQVIDLADGIPLILQLALRYLETGGRMEDLPKDLPPRIIAGYLHGRILDRVGNPAFKEVASGALVLRRLTADMVKPVLSGIDGLTLPPGEPSEWFSELGREMSLVEGDSVLRVRPEVRTATLELLERDRAALVRTIDARAVKWYAAQDLSNPEIAAELVYHRLRLGDVGGAEQAWRDEVGAFLTYAEDEIRDPTARSWLHGRLGAGAFESSSVGAWESEAAERIRSVRGRGLDRNVAKILRERQVRTDASPLVFHEAFEHWSSGEKDAAWNLLESAGDVPGPIGRDRTVLKAQLAIEGGDREKADFLLASIEETALWTDRRLGEIESLAVQAARMRLAVNFDDEAALLNQPPDFDWKGVQMTLSSVDVLLPRLKLQLRSSLPALEATTNRINLESDAERATLLWRMEDERAKTLPDEPPPVRALRDERLRTWSASGVWNGPRAPLAAFPLSGARYQPVATLAELGWRRWWLAASRSFLPRALKACKDRTQESSLLMLSIVGAMALFALRYGDITLGDAERSLGELVQFSPLAREAAHVRRDKWDRIETILKLGVNPDEQWSDFRRESSSGEVLVLLDDLLWYSGGGYPVRPGPFLLSLLAPDPLEQLVADLAGRAERVL